MPKRQSLQSLPPEPINETTPLLHPNQDGSNTGSLPAENISELEAQAEQERREYESGHIPLATTPSTKRLLATMSSLWTVTFFAALDTTVVATLSNPISAAFHSGTSFSWIATGYLIANAAFQPLSGKLTDIYGRRAGLIFAFTFFSAGTLICGLAQSATVMIVGRVIAGAGGGCLNTISVFVASDLIPLRRRGVWQGIGNIVFGLGMGLGGVFGGWINDTPGLGWRWAFYIQIPFAVVGGIFGSYMLDIPVRESDKSKIQRVDFLGAGTLVTALVLLLLGLNSGGNIVPWNHPLVYVSIPLSFLMLLAFIYIEDRIAAEPIIPVRLLANRSVAAACLTNWFMTMSVFSLIYYGPIFFQVVRHVSPTRAGTLFIPQAIGTSLGSLASGIVMRLTGKYWQLNILMQILALLSTSLILWQFDENVPAVSPFIFLFMEGTAYGSMLTITLIALISAVDHKYQAVITSASYAFRSTGSSIGITIAGAVFQNLLKSGLYDRFGSEAGAADRIQRIRESTDELDHLPEGWYPGVIASYVDALRGVWVVVVGFAALTAIVSGFIKQHKLYNNLDRK